MRNAVVAVTGLALLVGVAVVALPVTSASAGSGIVTLPPEPIYDPFTPRGQVNLTDVSVEAEPHYVSDFKIDGSPVEPTSEVVVFGGDDSFHYPARSDEFDPGVESRGGQLSSNGRYVAFIGPSSLVAAGADAFEDVFVRDLTSGTLTRVSVTAGGGQTTAEPSLQTGGISTDGRYVVFTSNERLTGDDTDDAADVFVRDRTAGTTTMVSRTTAGAPRAAASSQADVTPDGRYITYTADPEVLRYDRVTGTTVLVGSAQYDPPQRPSISDNGSVIAFYSGTFSSSSVTPYRVYLRDLTAGTTTLVTGPALPPPPLPTTSYVEYIGDPSISPDGNVVAVNRRAVGAGEASAFGRLEVVLFDRRNGTSTGYPVNNRITTVPIMGVRDSLFLTLNAPYSPEVPWRIFRLGYLTYGDLPATASASRFVPVQGSRVASSVPITPDSPTFVDLSDDVPAGTTAVAVNVTITSTGQRSFVSVCPADTSSAECEATSTLNPYPGRDVANLSISRVGPDRLLRVEVGTGGYEERVTMDLVGYFTSTGSAGLDFKPIAPARRPGDIILGQAESSVVGLAGAPAGATAAAVRVTVAGVTGNTYVSACALAVDVYGCRGTSTVNANQQDASNLSIVPISSATGNAIRLYNNAGQVALYLDVVGWFVPAGQGAQYVPFTPTRAVARLPIGSQQSITRSFASFVPGNAVAVAANVTATGGITEVSYVSVCPAGTPVETCSTSSVVNATPGQDIAASTFARLGSASDVTYFNNQSSTLLFTDLQGYFVPSP